MSRQPTPFPTDSPDSPPGAVDLPSALAAEEHRAHAGDGEAGAGQPHQRTGLIGRLVTRFWHIVHEVGKFGVVGLVAFAVDSSVFNLLLNGLGPLPARTVSTVIAASIAFVGNRFWTWQHRPRSGLRREYTLYFLFNAIGLAIGLVCLWLSHDVLGAARPEIFQTRLADNISSLGVGTVLGTLFRFWSYRRIVFRAPAPARETVSASAAAPAARPASARDLTRPAEPRD